MDRDDLEPRAPNAPRGPLDRDELERLVADGMTVREIGAAVDRSLATVRHWLRTYGLKTARTTSRTFTAGVNGTVTGDCERHGTTRFAVRSDGGHRCLRCRSEAVSDRRRRLKEIVVPSTADHA